MPDGGRLELEAIADNDLQITVTDSGLGLSEENLRRLFEPFVTTKQSGTGLGLTIVERIAEVHGGTVTAENRAPRGARFTLHLPLTVTEVEA